MERPPFCVEEMIGMMSQGDVLEQAGVIELPPMEGEKSRLVSAIYGCLDDGEEVFYIEEVRDHGRIYGYDTHLRKRVLVVNPSGWISHLSQTRSSRESGQDISKYAQIHIHGGIRCKSDELESEMESAYLLLQEIYQYAIRPRVSPLSPRDNRR